MEKEVGRVFGEGLGLLWSFGIASFAGFIKYLQRFTGTDAAKWEWTVFLAQVLTAGFVGLVTDWLLAGWNVSSSYRNFAIAVGGWGGGETIVFFQQMFRDWLSRAAQATKNDAPKN